MITTAPTLETERLRLRTFRAEDGDAHHAMLADPAVVHFLHSDPMSREDAWRRMLIAPGMWMLLGYGYWVVERRDDGRFVGNVGFGDFRRDVTPSLEGVPEIGWIFASEAHGQGFATEAVKAALAWADEMLNVPEIVAIISPGNCGSINVARKAGFREAERAPYKGEDIVIFRR
jgi:RimJ/RimL family protein N-acetyltransferase